MDPVLKKELAEQLAAIITEHHLWAVVLAVGGAIGLIRGVFELASIFTGHQKTQAESTKIDAERTKIELENIEKLHAYETKYEDSSSTFNLGLSILVDALNQRAAPQEINKVREELIAVMTQDLLVHFGQYLDVLSTAKARRDKISFIKTDVLKFIETLLAARDAVNLPGVLTALEREPLQLSRSSLSKIWSFCGCLHFWNAKTIFRVWQLKKKFSETSSGITTRRAPIVAAQPTATVNEATDFNIGLSKLILEAREVFDGAYNYSIPAFLRQPDDAGSAAVGLQVHEDWVFLGQQAGGVAATPEHLVSRIQGLLLSAERAIRSVAAKTNTRDRIEIYEQLAPRFNEFAGRLQLHLESTAAVHHRQPSISRLPASLAAVSATQPVVADGKKKISQTQRQTIEGSGSQEQSQTTEG